MFKNSSHFEMNPSLENHIYSTTKAEMRDLRERSFESDTEYQDAGEVRKKIGEFELVLNYHQTELEFTVKGFEDTPIYEVEQLYIINSISGEKAGLDDIFKDPPIILFAPTAINQASLNYGEFLLIAGDVLNPYKILTIYHEAGHFHFSMSDKEVKNDEIFSRAADLSDIRKKVHFKEEISVAEALKLLEDEERSWEFALSHFENFIGDNKLLSESEVKNFIHKYCLAGYSILVKKAAMKTEKASELISKTVEETESFVDDLNKMA